MTTKSVTIRVHEVRFGDVWRGAAGPGNRGPETVTGIVNNRFDAKKMDITLTNNDQQTSRMVTVNRNQWFAVLRDI